MDQESWLEDFDALSEAFTNGFAEHGKSQFIQDFDKEEKYTAHHIMIIEWMRKYSETWSVPVDILRIYRKIRKKKDRFMKKRKRAQEIEGMQLPENILTTSQVQVVQPEHPLLNFTGKKLIIFDLNKVLIYRTPRRNSYTIRPYALEFIKMASIIFRLAVWTSGSSKRCMRMVNALFQYTNTYSPLLFSWFNDKCLESDEYNDIHKRILLKNLSQVWDVFPDYNVTNTVIVDDSPEKCACNPAHTAIHPIPYMCRDESDTELLPEGPLWALVKGLGQTEDNVQGYLSCNPYNAAHNSSSTGAASDDSGDDDT